MKRMTALFLTLALTLSGAVSPLGADSFRLTAYANGENKAAVSVGGDVEITLSVEASGSYTFYSMQDYVKFDPEYLQLDPGSISVKQVLSAGEYVDLMNYSPFSADGAYDRVFVNRASLSGVEFSSSETVLTFTLTALKEGTTEITHVRPEMTDGNNSRCSIAETGATVVISDGSSTEETTEATETTTAASSHSSGGGGGGSAYYVIHFSVNGTITDAHVIAGSRAVKPADPALEGYTFEGWYTDTDFTTAYDFTSTVTSSFTLYAYMKPVEDETASEEAAADETEETSEEEAAESEAAYTDVDESDWFYSAVEYMKEQGIMLGISEDEFAPYMPLTRGMFVTVLHRLEGTPEPAAEAPFEDVSDGQWYSEAVDWGYENNIIYGYSEREYGVNDRITREQMAAIIYRYAEFKGVDTAVDGEADFNDSGAISNYAKTAVKWMREQGFMTGDENKNFRPLDNATRAETAQVFMNVNESFKDLA